ncbi:hypothetical protein FD22_GL000975 [Loigolactobacillus coryniformis subsp. coryniformis KCTC 3167 = DSM 20001]|jgi:hypothetical protein|uniref:SnoaL-like domain-containing protein n=2 Tax=Loigolactobacillus coryniformis TaxID=1610 RepID=A0A0R1FDC2_9LACO|nr:hypothetical protein FD22_GL000975 [Loigolactobacillus coryniformis subsp. coryniformis KCTC 3167 = DSM 20001]
MGEFYMATPEKIFATYVASWLHQDEPVFLATLATDVVIYECYGPCYQGKDEAQRWFEHWHRSAENKVLAWTISATYFDPIQQVHFFEWRFRCRYNGVESVFRGCSIVKIVHQQITLIKEFEMQDQQYRPFMNE